MENNSIIVDDADNLADCCNSGCNNCVLDQRHRQSTTPSKRVRLLENVYKRFEVLTIQQITETVSRFRFKFLNHSQLDLSQMTLGIQPTHHLMLRVPLKTLTEDMIAAKHDKETIENYVSRPYTPVQWDDDHLTFDILVKFEPNGRMSEHIRNFYIGSETEWKGVYGDFCWTPNPLKYRQILCICQGVAIAPHYPLISSILSNENDETLVHLICCFKSISNCLLRAEVAANRRFWNFTSNIYLSQQKCDSCRNQRVVNCDCIKSNLMFEETICTYRFDESELRDFYKRQKTNLILTLFCGTNALENVITNTLAEMDDIKLRENYFRIE